MNEKDFEHLVGLFYEGLYRFAYSLAGNADDAFELTQDTFARLLAKHAQIRDRAKTKAWLSTTLYRTYLGWKRRDVRYPHVELAFAQDELPTVSPEIVDNLQNESVVNATLELEERYRVPLALYYFEQHSYAEIAEMLEIPIGTVTSRLSRGKELMRKSLSIQSGDNEGQAGQSRVRIRRN